MKPVKELKMSYVVFFSCFLSLIMVAVFSPGQGSQSLGFDFLVFPSVQKALGVRIPVTDYLDTAGCR